MHSVCIPFDGTGEMVCVLSIILIFKSVCPAFTTPVTCRALPSFREHFVCAHERLAVCWLMAGVLGKTL